MLLDQYPDAWGVSPAPELKTLVTGPELVKDSSRFNARDLTRLTCGVMERDEAALRHERLIEVVVPSGSLVVMVTIDE